jgi:glucose/arabinose dehydrogenase
VRPLRTALILSQAIVLGALALAPAAATTTAGSGTDGRASAAAIGIRQVAGGLDFPAGFTFAPNGRIFYGERFSGQIRVFDPDTRSDRLFFDVPGTPPNPDGEQGLLGVELHPRYSATRLVYAFATRVIGGEFFNQIIRVRNAGGHGTGFTVIFSSPTGRGDYHDGGRILFGPDGMLYAIVGDSHHSANAQDRNNPLGKILRMRPNGTPAPGNPFGNRIFAYGIRNSFGFGFDPRTGRLWETENGPGCNDELNRVVRGGNYAWGPHQTCEGKAPQNTNQDGPNRILPERFYSPPIAPTGLVFCGRCGLGPGNRGKLFFGAWNTRQIRRVTLTQGRLGVRQQSVVMTHNDNVLSMERGPGGGLFFSDPNSIQKLVRR